MAVLVVEAAVAEEEVEDVVLVVKVVGAKVDTEEVMAAVTDKAVMAVAMMDTEEATIITAVGTAAMVVTTTVDTEAQATAESRGEVVVRTKGTNPINGNHSLRPQCNSHCNRWFPISSLVKSSFH